MNFNDLFIYEDGVLLNKQTGHYYTHIGDSGYNIIWLKGKNYRAHRIIWQMFHGTIDSTTFIDHIDGDKLNNRIENLRIANRSQNAANSKTPKSKENGLPKGVSKYGNKYRAWICKDQKNIYLGTYISIEEAKRAYDTKAVELFGTYAKL